LRVNEKQNIKSKRNCSCFANLHDDKKVNKASICQLNNSLLDLMEQLEHWHHHIEAILEDQDERHQLDNVHR
jgi:hypothetical protein